MSSRIYSKNMKYYFKRKNIFGPGEKRLLPPPTLPRTQRDSHKGCVCTMIIHCRENTKSQREARIFHRCVHILEWHTKCVLYLYRTLPSRWRGSYVIVVFVFMQTLDIFQILSRNNPMNYFLYLIHFSI